MAKKLFDGFSAPISEMALLSQGNERPPIIKEWESITTNNQDIILLWAGSWNRNGGRYQWSWQAADISSKEDRHIAVAAQPEKIERLLSPMAHEGRVRIMQAMYDGPKSSSQLAEATGLKGGNLYYHLKELIYASYVDEKNGLYDLTGFGCQMLVTMSLMAEKLISD